MSVTQDYKILTFSPDELRVIGFALTARRIWLLDLLKGEQEGDYLKMLNKMLDDVEQALVKVQA